MYPVQSWWNLTLPSYSVLTQKITSYARHQNKQSSAIVIMCCVIFVCVVLSSAVVAILFPRSWLMMLLKFIFMLNLVMIFAGHNYSYQPSAPSFILLQTVFTHFLKDFSSRQLNLHFLQTLIVDAELEFFIIFNAGWSWVLVKCIKNLTTKILRYFFHQRVIKHKS